MQSSIGFDLIIERTESLSRIENGIGIIEILSYVYIYCILTGKCFFYWEVQKTQLYDDGEKYFKGPFVSSQADASPQKDGAGTDHGDWTTGTCSISL